MREPEWLCEGRLIGDNILITQELLSCLDAKVRGSNVILNLDMAKAYDRMEWVFLYQVLGRFGFDTGWITKVQLCVENYWFSVLVNGSLVGYFKSKRGLRQRDPIFPILFHYCSGLFVTMPQ